MPIFALLLVGAGEARAGLVEGGLSPSSRNACDRWIVDSEAANSAAFSRDLPESFYGPAGLRPEARRLLEAQKERHARIADTAVRVCMDLAQASDDISDRVYFIARGHWAEARLASDLAGSDAEIAAYRIGLKEVARIGGDDSVHLVPLLESLAAAIGFVDGERSEVRSLLERSLEIRRTHFGEGSPWLAPGYAFLAWLTSGSDAEKKGWYEEALRVTSGDSEAAQTLRPWIFHAYALSARVSDLDALEGEVLERAHAEGISLERMPVEWRYLGTRWVDRLDPDPWSKLKAGEKAILAEIEREIGRPEPNR